ncbi:MAG: LysM peptidoglycan-binding domain-containing protein [Chloroflexi bacterium]|nr:LysM peptidoglycan-binding domain-containing protein [Chloroflexota bacterium]
MDAWGRAHEDRDASGNPNPDRAALVCTRLVGTTGQTALDPLLVRRIRAKAAWDGRPLPDLTHLTTVNSYALALGDWGRRTASHIVGPGDTLYNLAKVFYGDGSKYRVIALFNGLSDSDVIHDGDALLIPEPTQQPNFGALDHPIGSVSGPATGGPPIPTRIVG